MLEVAQTMIAGLYDKKMWQQGFKLFSEPFLCYNNSTQCTTGMSLPWARCTWQPIFAVAMTSG